MSKSLKIENGDLNVGVGRSYEMVSGVDKLAQDLRLWVLEQIGTDPATPSYGSMLDGGIINGNIVESFIGLPNSQERANEIKGEVISLLTTYQQSQVQKMERELITYNGRHTLDADEVLGNIADVNVRVSGDVVIVQAKLETLSNRQLNLLFPLPA